MNATGSSRNRRLARLAAGCSLIVAAAIAARNPPRAEGARAPSHEQTVGEASALGKAGPREDVLGIRLGMTEAEAHRRLAPLGRCVPSEDATGSVQGSRAVRLALQRWSLCGPELRTVIVGIDPQGRVASLEIVREPREERDTAWW